MWQLDYSQEARNYALDSGCPLGPYNEDVLIAIEALALTPGGVPPADYKEDPPGYYVWEVAGHLVRFQRSLTPHPRLYIFAIYPIQ